jgi:sulfoxide reductase heme-binding subunit YedZ
LPGISKAIEHRAFKPVVFTLCMVPAVGLGWSLQSGGLGANPIEFLIRSLGDWAIRFLLLALAVTPLTRSPPLRRLGRIRRMIGLFAFFYAALHVLAYGVLDQFFDWGAIWADIVKRRYITFGMGAFILLFLLAATSTRGSVRRLGPKRWKRLHRLVYLAAILAIIHYSLMVKADLREPLIYGIVLAVLLAIRIPIDVRPEFRR